jgi:2-polyprenyl-3-methyl-5-hydroxy-6-metoxy-1,4-benzoquinol methylase
MQDFWDKRYAETEFAYGVLPNEFLKEQLQNLSAGKILFVCEGEGRNAVFAAKQYWNVEAFDLSAEGKKKALQLAEQNNVTINYQVQDATTIQYPENSFDAIALIYAHFPETIRKSFHKKVMNWLKPNGYVIIEAFNPNQLKNASGGPKVESMLYTKELLKNDFNDLDIQQLSTDVIQLNEGKYHIGKADVIRFIGKKIKYSVM